MLVNPGLNPTASPAAGLGLAGMTAAAAPTLDPAILASQAVPTADGGMEFHAPANDDDASPRSLKHDANLAEALDDSTLSVIADELMPAIEADVDSNQEYFDILGKGLDLLGLKPAERKDRPFKGASAATHPLLKEAVVRFCANAGGELMPADGPAQCRIFGDSTPEKERLAQRKALYINYYLTEEDEEYADDFDQMLMLLGLYGSMFRKVWRDPLRGGAATSRHFSPYDVVTNDRATTMHGPWRVTQIEPMPSSEVKRLQMQAWFRDVDLGEPTEDETPAQDARAKGDWRRPTDMPGDVEHVLWHCHCLLDIPGLEHQGLDSEPSGLQLPYVVTVDRYSGKVLRIARNWNEDDPTFRPREYWVHYKYMPGSGFYGWGLIHLVGNDTDTLSVLRRQTINTLTLNSFPGGLRTKTTTAENTDLTVAPGEFKAIETGGLPIQSAVMPMPYKDLSGALPSVVEEVLSSGQRVASTADMAVGDAREDALPGTVLALIAQATKLESSVIKRCHRAQRKELRLLADLFGTMDDEVYPYSMNGQQGQAIKSDFGNNQDVSPVSDPNVPTQTQRLSLAQAEIQLAQQFPGVVQVKPSLEKFYREMGLNDGEIAQRMPPPQSGQPADPVTEFHMALQGAPLKADPAQDHVSHVQAHIGQLSAPGLAGTPPGNALGAHIAEHTALFYAAEFQRMTGVQMPSGPVPPQAQAGLDAQIAKAAAQASNQLRQTMLQLAPPHQQGDPNIAAKIQADMAKLQFDERDGQRKAAETARQDAVEWAKAQMTQRDNEAQRTADLERARIDLEAAKYKAHSSVASDVIGHANERVQAQSQVAAGVLDHATERVSAEAAVKAAAEKTEQAKQGAKARQTAKKGAQ